MTTQPLRVGAVLTDIRGQGFCGGAFGRDSYGEKVVVGIGDNWVVALQEDGWPVLYVGDPDDLAKYR